MPTKKLLNKIICCDCFEGMQKLDCESIDCVVTSPPYWGLRDYGVDGQLGLEPTMEEYIEKLIGILLEIKRILKPEGTFWLNMGDTYSGTPGNRDQKCTDNLWKRGGHPTAKIRKLIAGVPVKSLCMVPERVAMRLIESGWILRNQIIWHKPNCMPSSIKDRFTVDFEKIFFFTKSQKYYFEQQLEPALNWGPRNRDNGKYTSGNVPIKGGMHHGLKGNYEGPIYSGIDMYGNDKNVIRYISKNGERIPTETRNKRTTWTVPTVSSSEEHYAMFPPDLIRPCILAGCPKGGIVLDPFMGTGVTAEVARWHGRQFIGFEINPKSCEIAEKRLAQNVLL